MMGKDYYKKPNCKKKGNFNKSHAKPDTKKSVEDYCFYIGSVNCFLIMMLRSSL